MFSENILFALTDIDIITMTDNVIIIISEKYLNFCFRSGCICFKCNYLANAI